MAWKIGLWIARIVATVVLAALLSVWTTGYVVSSYVQALLKQYEIPMEVEPVALSDVWGMLWGTDSKENTSAVADTNTGSSNQQEQLPQSIDDARELDEESTNGALGNENENSVNGENINAEDSENIEDSTDQQQADDQWEQDAEEALAPIENGSEPTITPEDIDASKDMLSEEDKERMFYLLMSNLPTDSMQLFSTYIEDGLTDQELLEVQQVMAQHLSKEEYEELTEILEKY